jgi:hypothetical protein
MHHPRVPLAPGRGRGLGTMIAGALAATAIAAAVLIPTASPAWATTETLTLTPNHGLATDSFTAIYEVSPPPADCGSGAELVNFYWDNGERLHNPEGDYDGASMEQKGGHCRASMKITPSANANFGTHQVRGDRAPYVGPVTVYGTASAQYTIDFPSESPAASHGESVGGGSPSAANSSPRVRPTAPVSARDPLLGTASPDAPAVPGPGFTIEIPAARGPSAASVSERRPRGASGPPIGLVGAVAAVAVAWAIVVGVRRRRWSATRV